MRRRRRKNNTLTLAAYSGVLVLCMGVVGYAAFSVYGKATADRYGCFADVPQAHTLVLVDASEPRFDAEQARSLRRYFAAIYDKLGFNEELSVYTSEGDQIASVLKPRFHVCGQASSPEQLEGINAEAGSAGYLKKQRQRLYEKVFAPEVEALLSEKPDEARRQTHQSPILELIADLSRSPELKAGSRLILVSDLIQNSDSAHFCVVKGDMPRFAEFAKRTVYQSRLRPRPLEGTEVEVLMLQRPAYGPYCRDEEELRSFWRDYLVANGAEKPRFVRIRHGRGG